MRRFKKQMPIRKYLSDELIQHIFEKETCDHFGKTGAEIAGGLVLLFPLYQNFSFFQFHFCYLCKFKYIFN